MRKRYPLKKKGAVREWIEAIIFAAILATFLRSFFFQVYKIPTTSMVPTLMPGDKIFVTKLAFGPKVPFTDFRIKGFREPQVGDVVVFLPPQEAEKAWYDFSKKQYIKRLIAVGGDKVSIEDGNVYVNGNMVLDPRIARNYYYNQGDYLEEEEVISVPEGEYFFLGDNSISSLDSRFWGTAKKEDIVGKAVFVWWPPKRIGIIE
ncbi:MAG: signal peptidase I [Candidatus Omnitrophica bacterium]|nr:signal peptidase I [Candidatus Omnitrophota bacterium]MBD3269783.1 signal peptidase I [Candidatus Omnitrophota bacterium]